jgi:hypothetical protein
MTWLRVSSSGGIADAASVSVNAMDQQHARYDLSPVAFAAAVLRFILAGSEPSFDVNLTAFAQERDGDQRTYR